MSGITSGARFSATTIPTIGAGTIRINIHHIAGFPPRAGARRRPVMSVPSPLADCLRLPFRTNTRDLTPALLARLILMGAILD